MNTESKRPRLLFLDNIKVLFSILVIFQHARVTYEGSGWWYYIESNPVDTVSSIFFLTLIGIGALFQSSLLGLFFLMGGYFTPKSYDRKGASSFLERTASSSRNSSPLVYCAHQSHNVLCTIRFGS